jgi:hypothetical protein
MSTTSAHRRQKPRPIKLAMSLLSKVAEVAVKAVGDVGEAAEVDLVAACVEVYPRKKSTR